MSYTKGLHNFLASPGIIIVVKSRKMVCVCVRRGEIMRALIRDSGERAVLLKCIY